MTSTSEISGSQPAAATDTDARLEALEIKLAHQEQTVQTLSDEVYRQQRQIDRLEAVCRELRDRLRALTQTASAPPAASDEKPPHY